MAYFLKKTTLKNRTYLAIYESFYSHDKKGTAHKTYKSMGSIETLKANGIDDPIALYQKEVDELNKNREAAKARLITDQSPLLYLGFFPLKSIMEKLDIKKHIDYYKKTTKFEFDLYSLLSSLIYARSIKPCSKLRTFHDVIPCLYENPDYSYDQLLDGLSFFGDNYAKLIEMFSYQVKTIYGINDETTYFDCTNFYFEIDREDDFRRKGPSKENRKDPIIGLGLLLDSHQIPISMKMFPGNESEKPVLREIIKEMKGQNETQGRTIRVADKGLNCSENIIDAIANGDGYLFSKSVKMLPETEIVWVLLENGWKTTYDEKNKPLYQSKSCIDEFPFTLTDINGKKKTVMLKEKRLVTYNPELAVKQRAEINKMIDKAERLRLSQAKKSEYGESAKYLNFESVDEKGNTTGKKVKVTKNQKAIDKDLALAGYNMLVTSELKMSDRDMYDTYHNLWMIEESFKIMKSDLDARPVFLQKRSSIEGHFLICYLTVLLERLFQYNVLHNKYPASVIFRFIKEFRVVKSEYKYINITAYSPFISELTELTSLPLMHYYLSETKIAMILNHTF